MNQSILFPDIQTWDIENQAVIFPAQNQGSLIECLVTKSYLDQLNGCALKDELDIISLFLQYRFDLEEQAELLIEEEEFSPSGQIIITLETQSLNTHF